MELQPARKSFQIRGDALCAHSLTFYSTNSHQCKKKQPTTTATHGFSSGLDSTVQSLKLSPAKIVKVLTDFCPVPPAHRAGCSLQGPCAAVCNHAQQGSRCDAECHPCSCGSELLLLRYSALPHPRGSEISCISQFRSREYVGATAFVLPPASLHEAALLGSSMPSATNTS